MEELGSYAERIIFGLTSNAYALESGDLAPYGIERPREVDDDRIYKALINRATIIHETQPWPLSLLPDAARIYRRDTGNLILDFAGAEDSYTVYYYSEGHFTWDQDVPELRQAWEEAKPFSDQLRAFESWLHADEAHLHQTVALLLQLGGYR